MYEVQPAWPQRQLSTGLIVGLAGALLMVVGAWLPWVSFTLFGTSVSVKGIETDGKLTLILGALALLLFGQRYLHGPHRSPWGAIVLGGLGGAISSSSLASLISTLEELSQLGNTWGNIGIGLYLTLTGSALAGAGGLLLLRTRHART
jgi:hypothetical protein